MIEYRLHGPAGDVELALDVDNASAAAPVVFHGSDDAIAAVRRALLERVRVAGRAWERISGEKLRGWMASPALADLRPELVHGREIFDEGGTFSRHDPATAIASLGRGLARLARLPRGAAAFSDDYQWTHIAHRIRYGVRELTAFDAHLGDAHSSALEAMIADELAQQASGAVWSPAQVLAAFRAAAAEHADEADLLRAMWRRLDGVGLEP
ncbi:MAG TPA: hypothetical protein VLM79_04560 [Kofleriaceae bacterium]|nr:hypothetical protein [Kofleriaceae bacterium]